MEQTCLITGASRGLGHALALALAPTHHIIAVGRTIGALEDLDDSIKAQGGAATLAPMDITKPEAMQQLCRAVHDRWGGLNLWLHTAIHAGPLTPTPHLGDKDLDTSIAVNLRATARLITYLAPLLGPAGRAVFFDDPQGGAPFFGHYGSTKAGQIALARSWAAETQRIGPQVRILSPRPMPTATRARFHPGEDRSTLFTTTAEAVRLLPEILP